MTPKEFVTKYLSYARETESKTGISAISVLTQAALESGWGRSAPGFMFFGMKASKNTPENKRQLLTTTEYLKKPDATFPEILSVTKQANGLYKYRVKDWFRKYDSPEECFTGHAQFFFKNKRYAKALEVKSDPDKFFEEIAAAGYATAPGYADTLKNIARTIQNNIPVDEA